VRLNRGLAQQFGTIDLEEVFSYAAGEEPWTKGAKTSPSFTCRRNCRNIARMRFLDAEKNFSSRA